MSGDASKKKCSSCGKPKRRDEFHRNKSRRDGLAIYCKECINRDRREQYAKNPGKFLAVTRASRARAPERHRQRTKRWYDEVKRPLTAARARDRRAALLASIEALKRSGVQVCNRCKETKGLDDFYTVPTERRLCGYDGYCKQCRKEMSRRDYYRDQERRKQTRRDYRQAHLDQERARDRARSSDPKRLESARRWRERNPERLRINQARGALRMLTDEDARRKQLVRTKSRLLVLEGLLVQSDQCAVCGQPGELVIHHRGYEAPDAASDVDWVHRGRCHGQLDKARRERERMKARQ